MNRNFKIIAFVLVSVLALGAGVYLVNTNLETRKGATFADINVLFLPDSNTTPVNKGDIIPAFLVLNTKEHKLSAVDVKIKYDKTKLRITQEDIVPAITASETDKGLLGAQPDMFYKKVNDDGTIDIAGVVIPNKADRGGNLKDGIIKIVKLGFTAIEDGVAEVSIESGYENVAVGMNVSGDDMQLALKNISKGSYTIGSSTATNGVLKFKVAFDGVSVGNECTNNWKAQVVVKHLNDEPKQYSDVALVRDTSVTDKAVFKGQVTLSGFPWRENIAVFVKGPKHLQTKFGEDNQSSFYDKAGGLISVSTDAASSKEYNFSGYKIMAGDVTGQTSGNVDGKIDGLDFSYVKAEAIKGQQANQKADLDGNCTVNNIDLSLLMMALKSRMDQIY